MPIKTFVITEERITVIGYKIIYPITVIMFRIFFKEEYG